MAHKKYKCIFPLLSSPVQVYEIQSSVVLVFRGCSSAHRDFPDCFPPETLLQHIFSTSRHMTNSVQMTIAMRIPIQVVNLLSGSETALKSPAKKKTKKYITCVHIQTI